jgi:hypothetical protein
VRLDRVKALRTIRQDLSSIEQSLAQYEKKQVSSDLLSDIRYFIPALTKIREYQLKADQLKLLAANDSTSGALTYNPNALQQRIYDMLSKLRVKLSPENLLANTLSIELAEQLTAQGVRVVSSGDAELVVSFSLSQTEKQNQGTQFVLLKGGMKVMDSSGQVIQAYGVNAKGGAYDQHLARQRAMKKISDKMGGDLVKGLFENL